MPDRDDAGYAYGKQQASDIAYVATKYRELWEDIPAELLVEEDDRGVPSSRGARLHGVCRRLFGVRRSEGTPYLFALAKAEMSLAKPLVGFYTTLSRVAYLRREVPRCYSRPVLAIIRPPEASDSPLDPFAEPSGVPAVDKELCKNSCRSTRIT